MTFFSFQKHLAASLRSHRAAARLTQADLAERAGVSTQWVGNLENAKGSPTLETLQRIADVMGTSVSALTWLPDKCGRPDDELNELISYLRRLPPGAISLTRDYVGGLANLLAEARGSS